MWTSIQYVTSGLTLVAFIVAAGVWLLKARLDARERLIKAADNQRQADLVGRALEFFKVETEGLTKQQRYEIAIAQIHARSKRYTQSALAICFVAILLAAVTGLAIAKGSSVEPSSGETETDGPSEPVGKRRE